nr:SDR family oxidoreductase [Devosia sp.]
MIAAGNGGSIVNTSSFVSKAPSIGTTAYAASKGALEAGPHNIRINTLLPGAIDTEMFRSLDGSAGPRTSPMSLSGLPPTKPASLPARTCWWRAALPFLECGKAGSQHGQDSPEPAFRIEVTAPSFF